MKIKCYKCGWRWNYNGTPKINIGCPNRKCHAKLSVKKLNITINKLQQKIPQKKYSQKEIKKHQEMLKLYGREKKKLFEETQEKIGWDITKTSDGKKIILDVYEDGIGVKQVGFNKLEQNQYRKILVVPQSEFIQKKQDGVTATHEPHELEMNGSTPSLVIIQNQRIKEARSSLPPFHSDDSQGRLQVNPGFQNPSSSPILEEEVNRETPERTLHPNSGVKDQEFTNIADFTNEIDKRKIETNSKSETSQKRKIGTTKNIVVVSDIVEVREMSYAPKEVKIIEFSKPVGTNIMPRSEEIK